MQLLSGFALPSLTRAEASGVTQKSLFAPVSSFHSGSSWPFAVFYLKFSAVFGTTLAKSSNVTRPIDSPAISMSKKTLKLSMLSRQTASAKLTRWFWWPDFDLAVSVLLQALDDSLAETSAPQGKRRGANLLRQAIRKLR